MGLHKGKNIPRWEKLFAEGKTENEVIKTIGPKGTCEVCNKTYYAKSPNTRTCSQKCGFKIRPNYNGGVVNKTRKNERRREWRQNPNVRKKEQEYARRYREDRRSRGLSPSSYKMYRKKCPICGQLFEAAMRKKTCSAQCATSSMLKEREKHAKIPRWDRLRMEGRTEQEIVEIMGSRRRCSVCGKAYYSKKIGIRTCSQKCGYKIRPNYKEGRVKSSQGYVLVKAPDHPDANMRGYILEHRLVIATKLGMRLLPEWDVHHINGIKDDNRPENLELMLHSDHYGTVSCPCCGKEVWSK